MAELNYCADGGWVVDSTREIPADPGEFYPGGLGGFCACNNLICQRCGRRARTALRLVVDDERGVDWAAAYEQDGWAALQNFRPSIMYPETRIYLCACGPDEVSSARAAEVEDRPSLRWRCGGHPRAYPGMVWHGIELREDLDFRALVERALSGWIPEGIEPERAEDPRDAPQMFWLRDLYRRLLGTDMADPLSLAVAACLTHADALVRARALRFFLAQPLAAGHERLLELAQGDRALFRGLPSPFVAHGENGPETLEDWLLMALAEPLCQGQRWPQVIGLLRREVLTPGRAAPVLEGLCQADGPFVVDYAEDIVRATPRAVVPLLLSLQRAGQQVGPVGERVVGLPGVERDAVRTMAKDFLLGAARNRVLKALKAT